MERSRSRTRGSVGVSLVALATVGILLFSGSATARADVVTEWNIVGLRAIMAKDISNQLGSRTMAMVHTAMFDAINAVEKTYDPYNPDVANIAVPDGTSPHAAGAAAAHRVLSTLYPDMTSTPYPGMAETFDTVYNRQLAEIPDGPGKSEAIQLGVDVADAIIALRLDGDNDHAEASLLVDYPGSEEPGKWRPTPRPNPVDPGGAELPGLPALAPGWPMVTPWAMTGGDQFRAAGPPDLNSPEYEAAYHEVKEIGARNSGIRTADQTLIARFWMGGIPGHWNAIARELSELEGNTLEENARLFALLSITLADASISGWDTKYHYGFWRPITAIREGEDDTNENTAGDPTWTPLLTTPNFPEYISGHSITSASAATVLQRFFGRDDFTITRPTATPNLVDGDGNPIRRTFNSLSEMIEEIAISRLWGGVHFSFGNVDGLEAGKSLGNYVYSNFLKVADEVAGSIEVGPLGKNKLPLWLGDGSGLRLQTCLKPGNHSKEIGPCLAAGGEFPYWAAEVIPEPPPAPLSDLRILMEIAGAREPGLGMIIEATLRFRLKGASPNSTWSFVTPFGTFELTADEDGEIDERPVDIIAHPPDFLELKDPALQPIQKFFRASRTDNTPPPPVGFIGDGVTPMVLEPPFTFSVTGPDASFETRQAAVMGKIFSEPGATAVLTGTGRAATIEVDAPGFALVEPTFDVKKAPFEGAPLTDGMGSVPIRGRIPTQVAATDGGNPQRSAVVAVVQDSLTGLSAAIDKRGNLVVTASSNMRPRPTLTVYDNETNAQLGVMRGNRLRIPDPAGITSVRVESSAGGIAGVAVE